MGNLMTEGEAGHSLGHLAVVPAEGDHPRVEALVDVTSPSLLVMVEAVLVTNTSICGGGSPCQTNRASVKVSEGEQVGETIVVMVQSRIFV